MHAQRSEAQMWDTRMSRNTRKRVNGRALSQQSQARGKRSAALDTAADIRIAEVESAVQGRTQNWGCIDSVCCPRIPTIERKRGSKGAAAAQRRAMQTGCECRQGCPIGCASSSLLHVASRRAVSSATAASGWHKGAARRAEERHGSVDVDAMRSECAVLRACSSSRALTRAAVLFLCAQSPASSDALGQRSPPPRWTRRTNQR